MPATSPREPDFTQLLKVLRGEAPDRPTLFEFYLNGPLYERLAGRPEPDAPAAATRREPIEAMAADDRADVLARLPRARAVVRRRLSERAGTTT